MKNNNDNPRAIQIVAPFKRNASDRSSFTLISSELDHVFSAADLKDRNVIVVSICGAFRKGKSFLLNFFLKYLIAQYKKRDVSDWIGENEQFHSLNGFKWRGGPKPETIGIWMWSEIFTHDYDNGEKVAIILLDTQGTFDHQSNRRDWTVTFALSILLSSVQCYNLMQNIQQDDLDNLTFFTEYARLVEGSKEKPFQELVCIVRDYPYSSETGYGWNGEGILNENYSQNPESKALLRQIQSSFKNIRTFLMPSPGRDVAEGTYDNDIRKIDRKFKQCLADLVPSLFAPDNLIVKRINGETLRARDFISYLQSFVSVFNGNTLPHPKSMLLLTIENSYRIRCNESIKLYVNSMSRLIDEVSTYHKDSDINRIHKISYDVAIGRFLEPFKLVDEESAVKFVEKLQKDIEEQLDFLKRANDTKRKHFMEVAKSNNENVLRDIKLTLETRISQKIDDNKTKLSHHNLQNFFDLVENDSLEQFEKQVMGDVDISNGSRKSLEQYLINHKSNLKKMLVAYDKCLRYYSDKLQRVMNDVLLNGSDLELFTLLENLRKEAKSKFDPDNDFGLNSISNAFLRRIEKDIEKEKGSVTRAHNIEQTIFKKEAVAHNEKLFNTLKGKFENKTRGGTVSYDDALNSIMMEFDAKKVGASVHFQEQRNALVRHADGFYRSLKTLEPDDDLSGSSFKLIFKQLAKRMVGKFTEPIRGYIDQIDVRLIARPIVRSIVDWIRERITIILIGFFLLVILMRILNFIFH